LNLESDQRNILKTFRPVRWTELQWNH